MKFWSAVLLVLMLCPAVQAYPGDGRDTETTVLPGDQNTNLHKLNAFGEYAVKKLKKIDQAIATQKGEGKNVNWSDLDRLISGDQQENEKILQKIAADTEKKVKNPQALVVKKDEFYRKTKNMPKSTLNDAAVVAVLRGTLRGVRP
ncbi:MAG: hypothetical protein IJ852_06600 [Alphaproteobacteria bacterium]|nr:hypothetical protein [Alphaproteobacteria bacterium]